MAVDRGGLQYTIQVKDAFSKTTSKFKSEMRSSKEAFAAFQKGVSAQRDSARSFKDTSKAIDEQSALLKRLAAESKAQSAREREAVRIRNTQQRDATKATQERLAVERAAGQQRAGLLKQEQQQLKASADAARARETQSSKISAAMRRDEAANLKAQQQAIKDKVDQQNRSAKQAAALEAARRKDEAASLLQQQKNVKFTVDNQNKAQKEAAKIAKQMAADKKANQKSDPGFQAQERLNKGLREETVQRKQIQLLQARARQQFQSGDIFGGAKSLKQAKALEDQLKSADKQGNSLLFTFRRLVGVLALFTIAREAVSGFQELVKSGIEFDDKVQSATISIAGLLVTVTDVRDALGLTVKPAEELDLAMQAARDQVKQLRQDALKTTATFEQLLDTFQVAIAPGFAAGLGLDQIRQLTISISQAASAIGVQQNQLSEEIRSLLGGTIQARTTRIATALGITNADIKRLKETGKLFEFLQQKFEGFSQAAQKQARSTLAGISTLIKGAVQELLGKAAQPLFDELISLSNEFLDKVLTIKDAEGNLKPNPAVVAGFESIFDALKEGAIEIRRSFSDLGFSGFENVLRAVGAALLTTIRFAIGFAQTLFAILNGIVVTVRTIGDFFGLTTKQLGNIAGALGAIVAITVAWNNTVGLLGVNFGTIWKIVLALVPGLTTLQAAADPLVGSLKASGIALAQIGAVLAVVIVGFDLLLGSIFDVNLSLTETVNLLGKGLAAQIKESVKGLKALAILLNPTIDSGERDKQLKALADEMRSDTEAFNKEVSDIISKATERSNRGAGFDPTFDFKKKLAGAQGPLKDFKGIISAADAEIAALAGSLFELQEQLFKTGLEFKAAFNSQDLQGTGEKIQSIFSEALVSSGEKLKKLNVANVKVQQSIKNLLEDQNISAARRAEIEKAASSDVKDLRKALEGLNLTEGEGQLVSLLRDEKDIRAGIQEFESTSLQLAFKKAAIIAIETTRDLNRQNVLAQANLVAERASTDAAVRRLGARRQATIEAQNALDIAKVEAAQSEESLQKQIEFEQKRFALRTGDDAPTEAERQSFNDLIAAQQAQLGLEQAINAEKEKRLQFVKDEAALVENGSIGQGVQRGLEDLVTELPTRFEAGITILKQSVTSFADFVSSSIVSAFDPTQDQSLQERFARFLQGLANIILQQIIQLAIQSALQKALATTEEGALEVATATTAASITVAAATTAAGIEIAAAQAAAAIRAASGGFGLHSGGLVRGFNSGGSVGALHAAASAAHSTARGYANGGVTRPRGLHPADTVPAWLSPGEFVVRKRAVQQPGMLAMLKAVNQGAFGVPAASPSSGGAAASSGMAKGGLVSDTLQRASARSETTEQRPVIVPAVVAGERELDRMFAGGKTSAKQFLTDNAGIIRSIAKGK